MVNDDKNDSRFSLNIQLQIQKFDIHVISLHTELFENLKVVFCNRWIHFLKIN